MTQAPVLVGCRDECGARVENPEAAGWNWLQASKLWRCGKCSRDLDLVNEKKPEESEDVSAR